MAIYTRRGDKGKTGLFNGRRVLKSDLRIEVLGTIDEFNSIIGVVLAEIQNSKVKNQNYNSKFKSELILIQNDLLNIGSALANRTSDHEPSTMNYLQKRVREFEDSIDEMTLHLPKLSNFIFPGGGRAGAMLHLARTVCRRLERRIVDLNNKEKIDKNSIAYFNRLSDLLFTMARFVNFKERKKEAIWPV